MASSGYMMHDFSFMLIVYLVLLPIAKAHLSLHVDNERSRINPDGMYVGKVYSEMNRVKINKTFQGSGRLLAVNPQPFSSTFGFAGPVIAWLYEVAVGREGSTLTWWVVTPSPPFLTPCGEWRHAPGGGGSRGRVIGVYIGEIMTMSRERRAWDEMQRKTK